MSLEKRTRTKRSRSYRMLLHAISAVQFVLYAGCVVLHYFASHRVGVAHYITALSVQWQRSSNIHLIMVLAAVLIALCAAMGVAESFRRKGAYSQAVGLVVCATIFCVFAFVFSRHVMRAYYFLCFMLYVAALFQLCKTVLTLHERRS